jgi:hypothetical protein
MTAPRVARGGRAGVAFCRPVREWAQSECATVGCTRLLLRDNASLRRCHPFHFSAIATLCAAAMACGGLATGAVGSSDDAGNGVGARKDANGPRGPDDAERPRAESSAEGSVGGCTTQCAVLFGGVQGRNSSDVKTLDDTWVFQGGAWSQVFGVGPEARVAPLVAPVGVSLLLTAGYEAGGGLLFDTWKWSDSGWVWFSWEARGRLGSLRPRRCARHGRGTGPTGPNCRSLVRPGVGTQGSRASGKGSTSEPTGSAGPGASSSRKTRRARSPRS